MRSVETISFQADDLAEFEPSNLMAFDRVPFIVACPVSKAEIQNMNWKPFFSEKTMAISE